MPRSKSHAPGRAVPWDWSLTRPYKAAIASLCHLPTAARLALIQVSPWPTAFISCASSPARFRAPGGTLDGNGDGTAGDDLLTPTSPGSPSRITRIFGDSDGDGDVDATDFGAFRNSFGTAVVAFDFDSDGDVDASDFGQFRLRFGTVV